MAISFSPTEVLKIFRERGIRDREAVAGYIESVSSVASDLVRCWIDICDRWAAHKDQKNVRRAMIPMLARQLGSFYEASEHYERASTILGGRLKEPELSDLFDALGTLLETRNRTKKLYTLELERIGQRQVSPDNVDEWRESIGPEDLYSMIDAMQQEAATLRALAASIRSQA